MHYKAPDNSLHFIEPEFSHLLPAGSVPITDDEAEALRPKPTALDQAKQQIAALESAITPRRIREAVLGIDGGWLIDADAQIAALRAQL
jgi:hypothetical protein